MSQRVFVCELPLSKNTCVLILLTVSHCGYLTEHALVALIATQARLKSLILFGVLRTTVARKCTAKLKGFLRRRFLQFDGSYFHSWYPHSTGLGSHSVNWSRD